MPLLAFAGAPFTVASYLIEGRPSRTYEHTKALMHTDAALWHELMERLGRHGRSRSIDSQLDARRRRLPAVRLVGRRAVAAPTTTRSCCPTRRRCSPSSPHAIPASPGIHFGIGCDHLLESMRAAGPSVLGLDWRTPIAEARRRLGADLVVQGNLDPALVLAGAEVALAGADAVLADNGGHPGHIFNLGHGVQPEHRSRRAASGRRPRHTDDATAR